MKSFIKNNLKVFVSIIITTIIVGSVSVYAASQYFARDISFTPTNENFKKENGEIIDNVEDALNQLYEQSNLSIKNKFSTSYRNVCRSNTRICSSDVYMGNMPDIVQNYKYFKVRLGAVGADVNTSSLNLKAYSQEQLKWLNINFDTEYEIFSLTDGFKYNAISLELKAAFDNGNGTCVFFVDYYN